MQARARLHRGPKAHCSRCSEPERGLQAIFALPEMQALSKAHDREWDREREKREKASKHRRFAA